MRVGKVSMSVHEGVGPASGPDPTRPPPRPLRTWGPSWAAETAPAVADRATRKGYGHQSVSPSPSSLVPYFASHSACSLRRQRRSSCHSGYIHPGNRTGIKPNTATTNIANTKIVRNDLTGLFSSIPTGSASPNSPPNRKHNPTAGSITATVLRPRLKAPSSISRAASPQSLSENIANHQATSGNIPNRTQPIPDIICSLTFDHLERLNDTQCHHPWVILLKPSAAFLPRPDPMAAPTAPPTTAPTGPPTQAPTAAPA